MNEQAAQALLNLELAHLEKRSYADLAGLLGKVETKKAVGEDGKRYQLEQVFWDSLRFDGMR